jgi:tetratricopeptide (TPR) repeat protein
VPTNGNFDRGFPGFLTNGVLSRLKRQSSWLLLIDNLDDIKMADGLLPENGCQRHTIITTRNPDARGIPAEPLEVPLLDPNDSIDLLSTLSNIMVQPDSPEDHQAAEIVQKLGYLPLAIEQAAAYVREVTADFSVFLEEYERNHKKLHTWVPAGNRQYSNSIATTWSMSFHLLPRYVAKLLRFLAFLNPDDILIAFLESGGDSLESDLRHMISDQIEMGTTLLELEQLSLIKWNHSTRTLMIHRLVQTIVRDQMSNMDIGEHVKAVIDLCNQAFPSSFTNETWPRYRLYRNQVMESLQLVYTLCPVDETCATKPARRFCHIRGLLSRLTWNRQEKDVRKMKYLDICIRVGNFLHEDGKYDDSEKLPSQAVGLYRSLVGTENSDTLTAMHDLALTYQVQGRNADAMRMQEEVLEKRTRILGEEYPDTLTTIHNLAITYQAQGRIVDAAGILEDVLEKERRILVEEHTDMLATMHALALMYLEQGRNVDAAKILEEVLEKRRRIQGEGHPYTLGAMNALAIAYRAQGRCADAARILEEVLEMRRRILGNEHLDTLGGMYDLGITYQQQGRNVDAARILEDVLEERRIMGEEHPDTLATMHALAITYQEQGRNVDAARILEDVLEKQRRILGEEHPDTLGTMHDLAIVYRAQGRRVDSVKILVKVLEKGRRILGEEHPKMLKVIYNLANIELNGGT